MERYQMLQLVGEGSFGKVYKGRRLQCGQIVALKFIPKAGRNDADLLALRREIDILQGMRHENIVQMLDFFETVEYFCVVTEFAQVPPPPLRPPVGRAFGCCSRRAPAAATPPPLDPSSAAAPASAGPAL
jgi:hypothetical protein